MCELAGGGKRGRGSGGGHGGGWKHRGGGLWVAEGRRKGEMIGDGVNVGWLAKQFEWSLAEWGRGQVGVGQEGGMLLCGRGNGIPLNSLC